MLLQSCSHQCCRFPWFERLEREIDQQVYAHHAHVKPQEKHCKETEASTLLCDSVLSLAYYAYAIVMNRINRIPLSRVRPGTQFYVFAAQLCMHRMHHSEQSSSIYTDAGSMLVKDDKIAY